MLDVVVEVLVVDAIEEDVVLDVVEVALATVPPPEPPPPPSQAATRAATHVPQHQRLIDIESLRINDPSEMRDDCQLFSWAEQGPSASSTPSGPHDSLEEGPGSAGCGRKGWEKPQGHEMA